MDNQLTVEETFRVLSIFSYRASGGMKSKKKNFFLHEGMDIFLTLMEHLVLNLRENKERYIGGGNEMSLRTFISFFPVKRRSRILTKIEHSKNEMRRPLLVNIRTLLLVPPHTRRPRNTAKHEII